MKKEHYRCRKMRIGDFAIRHQMIESASYDRRHSQPVVRQNVDIASRFFPIMEVAS
ncbi:MAG: hypothetical protein ACI304_02010 [Lepagella sp.]